MSKTKTEPPTRALIVFDGTAWFVRRVRVIEHDLGRDEKVYRCDEHIAGPCSILARAVVELERYESEKS